MMDEKNIYLADGEPLLYSAENAMKNIYVTDRRVIFTTKQGKGLDQSKFKDIAISHISSIEWGKSSLTIFIVLGIMSFMLGLVLMLIQFFPTNIIPTLAIATGAISFIMAMFYKRSIMILITTNDKISFEFVGTDAEKHTREITKLIRSKE